MSGWNPPPAPGGPPGPYGYGPGPGPGFAAPPPRRKSNAGLVVGLLVGFGVIVVAIVVVLVVVVAVAGNRTIGTPPPSAGGFTRDYATETRISSQLNSQRDIIRRATNYRVNEVYSAVYGTGSEKYLFVGGNGDYEPDDLYSEFRSAVNAEISSNVTVTVIPLADAGGPGEAVCATVYNRQSSLATYTTALCAWATSDTFGTIMPVPEGSLTTSRSYTYNTVANTMRAMRDDLED